jgi:hypothetical protein
VQHFLALCMQLRLIWSDYYFVNIHHHASVYSLVSTLKSHYVLHQAGLLNNNSLLPSLQLGDGNVLFVRFCTTTFWATTSGRLSGFVCVYVRAGPFLVRTTQCSQDCAGDSRVFQMFSPPMYNQMLQT